MIGLKKKLLVKKKIIKFSIFFIFLKNIKNHL